MSSREGRSRTFHEYDYDRDRGPPSRAGEGRSRTFHEDGYDRDRGRYERERDRRDFDRGRDRSFGRRKAPPRERSEYRAPPPRERSEHRPRRRIEREEREVEPPKRPKENAALMLRSRSRSSAARSGSKRRSRSKSKGQKASARSGFDQKEMLPENFAMQQLQEQLAASRPTGLAPGISLQRPGAIAGGDGFPMFNAEVESFLQQNPVEPHAATRLRQLPPQLAQLVLQRGSLFGGRDPTAVLLGRIRDVTRGMTLGGAPHGVMPTGTMVGGQLIVPGVTGVVQPGQQAGGQQQQPQQQPQQAQQQPQQPQQQPQQQPAQLAEQQQQPQMQQPHHTGHQTIVPNDQVEAYGSFGDDFSSDWAFSEDPFGQQEQPPTNSGGGDRKKAPAPVSAFRSTPWSLPTSKDSAPAEPKRPSPATAEQLATKFQAAMAAKAGAFGKPPLGGPMQGMSLQQQQQQQEQLPQHFQEQFQQFQQRQQQGLQQRLQPSVAEDAQNGFSRSATGKAEAAATSKAPPVAPARPVEETLDPGLAEIRNKMQSRLAALSESLFGAEGARQAGLLPPESSSTKADKESRSSISPPAGSESAALPVAAGAGSSAENPRIATGAVATPSAAEECVSVATGDQAAAAQVYQQVMAGIEKPVGGGSADSTTAATSELSLEQQMELQRAAATAQYSQFWMHQQFQAQMEMFENQRMLASGASPSEEAMAGTTNRPVAQMGGKPSRLGSQPILPGDWTCKACGDHQFARNRTCRFCGAPKPAEPRS
mmetsp:Transcript_56764/g.135214  ORF Transcript_56764/g.135214 Transcript_56764/m.135214 type:complete len:764 (-) Transcript_56764:92-2383(-)